MQGGAIAAGGGDDGDDDGDDDGIDIIEVDDDDIEPLEDTVGTVFGSAVADFIDDACETTKQVSQLSPDMTLTMCVICRIAQRDRPTSGE